MDAMFTRCAGEPGKHKEDVLKAFQTIAVLDSKWYEPPEGIIRKGQIERVFHAEDDRAFGSCSFRHRLAASSQSMKTSPRGVCCS